MFALFIAVWVGNIVELTFAGDAHDHTHLGHDLSGPEFAVSAGYTHLVEENDNVLGIHAHLLHRLGDEGLRRHIAIGVGTEYLFSDEEHYVLMFTLAVHPWRGLVLSVSPGVQWAEHEGDIEAEYSTHLEAAYVFFIGKYDIGPVIGYLCTKDEEHYMTGLHIGIHL
jgi:hypothetical protein